MLSQYRYQVERITTVHPGAEIEVRFIHPAHNRYHPGVDRVSFERLLKHFATTPLTTQQSTVYNYGTVRKVVIESQEGGPATTTWLKKTKLLDFDLDAYLLHLVVSSEQPMQDVVPDTGPVSIRSRERMTYMLEGGQIQLDLTRVNMQLISDNQPSRDVVTYEVELNYWILRPFLH